MKQILALTLFLLLSLQSNAQSLIGCDSLIEKHYKISEINKSQLFLEEVKAAILCKYDSLDLYIFMGPKGNLPLTLIAPLGIKRIGTSDEDKVSMRELMQAFSSVHDMPDYGELRKKAALMMQGKRTGVPDEPFENSRVKEDKTDVVIANDDKEKIVGSIYAYTDYTKGLTKAKESGKSLLLYFSAYASIPSRKFEDQVLRDPNIQKIINEHFEVVYLFIDDRTPLTKEKIYYAKALKREVKYLGDIHLDLQVDSFKSDRQPMFYILDAVGKNVASSAATGVKEFTEFLSGGISKNR